MAFDEDKDLDYGPTAREQWAEDHGYAHYTCPVHGGFYSDTGEGCPSCPEEHEEDPDRDDDPDPGEELRKELREEFGNQRLEERYGNQN